MTVLELADVLHVSPSTLYRRCRKKGVDVAAYRDADTGALSQEGITAISALFDSVTSQGVPGDRGAAVSVTQQNTDDAVLQLAILQEQLAAARRELDIVTRERDRLLDQLADMTAALKAEQADRAQERLLLTGSGSDDPPRRGLFSWFRRR